MPDRACQSPLEHVIFHDGYAWPEGVGAMWRIVKFGLWLTLRVNQQLAAEGLAGSHAVGWLPNPAQMQNPHTPLRSMMGGLGIVQPTAPPPALTGRTAAWLGTEVAEGRLTRWTLVVRQDGEAAAAQEAAAHEALVAIRESEATGVPLAIYLAEGAVVHHHGPMGSWLHAAFVAHRAARAARAGAPMTAHALTEGGRKFLLAVHVRHFEMASWNLPAAYYASAVAAVFAHTPLRCDNSVVLLLRDADDGGGVAAALRAAAGDGCVVEHARQVPEDGDPPEHIAHAEDNYDPAADDGDEARRGHVFEDLELLALSDVLVGSNSEFSAMAQGMSARDTLVLCAPRRWLRADRDRQLHAPPCDETGVPGSILTLPRRLAEQAPLSSHTAVGEHVGAALEAAWHEREARAGAAPLWSRDVLAEARFNASEPALPA